MDERRVSDIGEFGLIGRITRELAALLKRDGFTSVSQAVGLDHHSRA